MLPTQILDEFCTANGIPLPTYNTDGSNCNINDEIYEISEFGMNKSSRKRTTYFSCTCLEWCYKVNKNIQKSTKKTLKIRQYGDL